MSMVLISDGSLEYDACVFRAFNSFNVRTMIRLDPDTCARVKPLFVNLKNFF